MISVLSNLLIFVSDPVCGLFINGPITLGKRYVFSCPVESFLNIDSVTLVVNVVHSFSILTIFCILLSVIINICGLVLCSFLFCQFLLYAFGAL